MALSHNSGSKIKQGFDRDRFTHWGLQLVMNFDWIVVVLFLITVAYVINQAISYVEQQATVKFQDEDFKKQLKEKTLDGTPLSDLINITFRIDPSRYKFSFDRADQDEQPKSLIMTVINISKAKDVNVYIDWDKSSITNYVTASRRLIRLSLAERLNTTSLPPSSQVPTPIAPGNTVTVRITGEDMLELKEDDKGKFLQPNVPILSPFKLQQDIDNKKLPRDIRDKREKLKLDFEEWRKPLEFSVRLMLRIADLSQNKTSEYQYSLLLKFTVSRVLWRHVLPWNPKK